MPATRDLPIVRSRSPELVPEHSDRPAQTRVPLEIWCGLIAVLSSVLGIEWDVGWHRSIGRDTFWTPAHMMIQFCGVLTALVCGYLVLVSTFGNSEARSRSVNIFGFRAPLGCFMAVWGGLAMLVSAPFDNWWHEAYGLDVKIISPPHMLLFVALRLISLGFLILIAGSMNRAETDGPLYLRLRWLFLFMGGLIITGHMMLITVATRQRMLHTATAYRNVAELVLFMFPLLWAASRHRWAATTAVSVYTVIRIGEVLLFPLFPASPKLGPVFTPVTHLVPAEFPLLLIVPACALDLLWQRTASWKPWLLGLVSGLVFMVALVGVQWPFATFLMSDRANNRFFDNSDFDYTTLPMDRLHHFDFAVTGWPLWQGMLRATLYACLACWLGIWLGRWIRSVQR